MSTHATTQQNMATSLAWKWLVDSPAILEPFTKAKNDLDRQISEEWAGVLDAGMTAKGVSKETSAKGMIAKMQLMVSTLDRPLASFESHISYVKLTHAHRPPA